MRNLLYIGTYGHVCAIDPSTGTEIWRTSISNGRGDVSLIEHDDKLFVGAYGHVYCIDIETGNILWKNDLKGLNYQNVTLAIAGKSVQTMSVEKR